MHLNQSIEFSIGTYDIKTPREGVLGLWVMDSSKLEHNFLDIQGQRPLLRVAVVRIFTIARTVPIIRSTLQREIDDSISW